MTYAKIRISNGRWSIILSTHLEDKLVPELLSLVVVRDKEVDDPLHDPTSITLARVHSGRQHYVFSVI